ncbi:helix-turn-helix domain-containing protein [Parvularcula sp. IMCC14364]|uniref:helix-turn-helix domain-containing protein n=1 Tax=Parvularcula sp. IMCC14364 TaxID=3067902 RepID=UPI002741C31F|nr:helix-turn-helix domain-containing protein [Parvularcula sp. IMCC14364]
MTLQFGDILKEWRGIRRISQLDLSLEADTSSRHVSFLESGRSRPSRGMILKLAEALQMPRAAVNNALLAAGYAPVFPDLPQDHEALAPVHAAINTMLQSHMPYPGVVVDRHWDLINANMAAMQMFAAAGLTGVNNMVEMLIVDDPENSIIVNWPELASLTLARLKTENLHCGGNPRLQKMIADLAGHSRFEGEDLSAVDLYAPVIPMVLRIGDMQLTLFSTIAQFGTVQDITLSDFSIELIFPVDDATRRWFESQAENADTPS